MPANSFYATGTRFERGALASYGGIRAGFVSEWCAALDCTPEAFLRALRGVECLTHIPSDSPERYQVSLTQKEYEKLCETLNA